MNISTLHRVDKLSPLHRMPCGTFSMATQRGLSLIELMIAVALAMILMLGALQIFLFSKNTYNNNRQLADIQENGRFALYSLTRDIRNAGYIGQCNEEGGKVTNHLAADSNKKDNPWHHDEGFFFGWGSTGKPASFPSSLQEGVFIQYAYGGGKQYKGLGSNDRNNNRIDWSGSAQNLSPLNKDEVGVISSGAGCDVFVNESLDKTYVQKKNPNGYKWSDDYDVAVNDPDPERELGFELLRMQTILYYVAADEEGVPTLYQDVRNYEASATGNSVKAIASGVENLAFEYGIRDSGVDDDLVVGSYVKHDAVLDWREVVSVKVSFTINSTSAGNKEFASVVQLRNSRLMEFKDDE